MWTVEPSCVWWRTQARSPSLRSHWRWRAEPLPDTWGKILTSPTLPPWAGWGRPGRGRFQHGFTSSWQELGHCSPLRSSLQLHRMLTWADSPQYMAQWTWLSEVTFRLGFVVPLIFSGHMASIPFCAIVHSVVSESLQPHRLQPARLPCPSLSVLLQRAQFMDIDTLQFCDRLFHGYQNHDKREREVGDKTETSQGWLRIPLWAFECL